MIRKRSDEYHYEFMQSGKRYYGVCEGCTTERAALAYEKKKRELAKSFADVKSVDKLMERRRQELTGRDGIPLDKAFDLSSQKPRRRIPSERVTAQKREAFLDFVKFMKTTHPDIMDLAAVTPSHAEEYIALLRSSGRFQKELTYERGGKQITRPVIAIPSSRTANLYQTVCTEVFRLLSRDAGIVDNPFDMPKPVKDEETREAFSDTELRLIYDNLDDFTRPLFILAITTALREGDICTLRWSDIDLQDGVIRRVMNKTGRLVEIPIAADLQGYLYEQKVAANDSDFVFPFHANMYHSNPTGVSYRVKQFLERIGIKTTRIPKGRTRAVSIKDLHSCRHTFCYYAGMRGIPLAVVQSIVGHMTPEMTKHYSAHATLEDKRRNMLVMSDFVRPAAPVALIEADTERAALLKELEALPTEDLRQMFDQYKATNSNRRA